MTEVDFYIIGDNSPSSRELFACKISEKAYMKGHNIFIHTENENQSKVIDDLLWTFRQGSFIPHETKNDEDIDTIASVIISSNSPNNNQSDVLINLNQDVPIFFSNFERVTEIVSPDEEIKLSARNRYRFYQERGYTIRSHNMEEK